MAKQDRRINEHGIDVRNLKPGMWITVRWCGKNDEWEDEPCLLLAVEDKQASYKGVRGIVVFDRDEKGKWRINRAADHDQVTAINGVLDSLPL